MSDFFHDLFFPDVEESRAETLAMQAISKLQDLAVLSSKIKTIDEGCCGFEAEPEHPLKCLQVEPSDHILKYYPGFPLDVNPNEVCVSVNRYASYLSVGHASWYRCPSCQETFGNSLIVDSLMETLIGFVRQSQHPHIICPTCNADTSAFKWESDVPAAFSHLAFSFYNWPLFKSDLISLPEGWDWAAVQQPWQLDVPALLSEVVGSRVRWSFGRL